VSASAAGRLILLSFPLSETSLAHPVLERLSIRPRNRISAGADYNTSTIAVENHCGTHVDAPAHFIEGAAPIASFGPEDLHYTKAFVLDCPKGDDGLVDVADFAAFPGGGFDCLLLRTGFGSRRELDAEAYLVRNPGLSPAAARLLRERFPELRCVGIDSVSMARYGRPEEAKAVHRTAFAPDSGPGRPLFFVEDMDFSPLSRPSVVIDELFVVPWLIEGIDSAPCTVLARLRG
jgi:arylformamidase